MPPLLCNWFSIIGVKIVVINRQATEGDQMTKRNLTKFVIFAVAALFISATFYVCAENTAFASTDRLLNKQKPSVNSKLTVDKAVYKKGESAAIYGKGFRKFEEITLKVEQYDYLLQQDVLRGTWVAVADEKGNFVSNWIVPSEGKFVVRGIGKVSEQETQTVIASSVTPVVVSGNPSCATLNASSDPAFAHITSNFGFKIDPPASGTFTFTNAAGRFLTGGAPSDATKTITIAIQNSTTFDWSATRTIKAIIVKGGSNANVYPYNPFSFGDTGLTTVGNGPAISHIEVCFDNSVTTAARVSAGGRVTDEFGNGIARTSMTVFNTNTSESQTVVSNSFGYYRFDNLEVGNFYIITAYNRKYTFEADTQSLVLNDAVENMDFRALPQ